MPGRGRERKRGTGMLFKSEKRKLKKCMISNNKMWRDAKCEQKITQQPKSLVTSC